MLATSPATSPQLHSSPSSSSLHYRRPSNTSSYNPHPNVSSSPRIGSLRRSRNSSPATASSRVRTRDASTQYSPKEQESQNRDDKRPSTISDTTANESAMSAQQNISNPDAIIPVPPAPATLVTHSPAIKRTIGDASLSSNESSKSPAKRPRADSLSDKIPKILPAKYEHCDPNDLVVMLSTMMDDLVRINEPKFPNSKLTRFHSRVAPGITVRDYLQRLTTHLVLQPVILLTMCFYLDKLCTAYVDFLVNSLTCHRFLITAATVATKGLSDSFWNNTTYARVGGVKLSELALLELEFLYRVEWRIIPENSTLEAYYHGLITRTDGYSLRPASVPESDASGGTGSGSTQVLGDSLTDNAPPPPCFIAEANPPNTPLHPLPVSNASSGSSGYPKDSSESGHANNTTTEAKQPSASSHPMAASNPEIVPLSGTRGSMGSNGYRPDSSSNARTGRSNSITTEATAFNGGPPADNGTEPK